MTPTRPALLALAAATLAAAPAFAQRLQLPDGSGRQLQLIDLRALLEHAPGPDLRLEIVPEPAAVKVAPPAGRAAPAAGGDAVFGGGGAGAVAPAPAAPGAPGWPGFGDGESEPAALGRMLARFVQPPLGDADDCRVLANRWLALLGSPEQIASVEQLLRTARAQRDQLLHVEVQLLQIASDAFAATVQPKLTKVQRGGRDGWEAIVPADGADAFAATMLGAASSRLAAPKLTVAPLRRATAAARTDTAYVKDVIVTPADGAGGPIADPVIGVVWHGWHAEMFVAPLADGTLGLACDVTHQDLQQPIPSFDTRLPGSTVPVTIQLPSVQGTRLQQTAVLAPGALVAIAARKADGTWLVALVRAAHHAK